jgi:hypothetical protein
MKPRRDTAGPDHPPGIVCGASDTAYSLRALGRITGLKEHGLRQLRAAGLRMTQVGREPWILGEDFISLVRRLRDRNGRQTDSQSEGNPASSGGNRPRARNCC